MGRLRGACLVLLPDFSSRQIGMTLWTLAEIRGKLDIGRAGEPVGSQTSLGQRKRVVPLGPLPRNGPSSGGLPSLPSQAETSPLGSSPASSLLDDLSLLPPPRLEPTSAHASQSAALAASFPDLESQSPHDHSLEATEDSSVGSSTAARAFSPCTQCTLVDAVAHRLLHLVASHETQSSGSGPHPAIIVSQTAESTVNSARRVATVLDSHCLAVSSWSLARRGYQPSAMWAEALLEASRRDLAGSADTLTASGLCQLLRALSR